MGNKRIHHLKTISLAVGIGLLVFDAILTMTGEEAAKPIANLAFLFLTIGILGSVLEKEN